MKWINNPLDTGYESTLSKTSGSSTSIPEKGICVCIGGIGICTCTSDCGCTAVAKAPPNKTEFSSAFKGLAV